MARKAFRHLIGNVKMLSAVAGAGVVMTMGVLTAATEHTQSGVSASVQGGVPMATVTKSSAPSELVTPFASPTYTATPCAKRATMPC